MMSKLSRRIHLMRVFKGWYIDTNRTLFTFLSRVQMGNVPFLSSSLTFARSLFKKIKEGQLPRVLKKRTMFLDLALKSIFSEHRE